MIMVVDFKREVWDWAEQVGVKPKEIHVQAMKTKWASCSARGRLTFSYALLDQAVDFRAYVIVHELLHLRYPTHNKMFKLMLKTHLDKRGIVWKS